MVRIRSKSGKRRREIVAGANESCGNGSSALLTVIARVDGQQVRALVDTGASKTVIRKELGRTEQVGEVMLRVAGGISLVGKERVVNLEVAGMEINLSVCEIEEIVPGVDVLLGVDAIKKLGGVIFDEQGKIKWVKANESETVLGIANTETIDDADFMSYFNGESWNVKWKWNENTMTRQVGIRREYKIQERCREDFDKEITEWIKDGILATYQKVSEVAFIMNSIFGRYSAQSFPSFSFSFKTIESLIVRNCRSI